MVPIHDTDIGEERWDKAAWESYELWEKIELRLRRRKRLWIFGTVLLFIMLSAVPIVRDRLPKWTTETAARRLAQEVNRIKRDANIDRSAYRIRFNESGSLSYQVERVKSCAEAKGVVLRTEALLSKSKLGSYVLLTSQQGVEIGAPGLVQSFCYDYLAGSEGALNGQTIIGFGIMPAQDLSANNLTAPRMDRLSVLLLSGPLAEISFD
jgi:hypothetical protein